MAFPTLFLDGVGDPTSNVILREIYASEVESFALKLKHLIRFGELQNNNNWHFRFASHPRFAYWAFNVLYRKRLLSQGSVFVRQLPEEANLTSDDYRNMLEDNSSSNLMSKLSPYAKNVTGTNAYWNKTT